MMTTDRAAEIARQLTSAFAARTGASRAAYQQAVGLLPGGVNRNIVYHPPYPPFVERGEGAYLTDLDGNRYLDLINNYTSLILGHCHPAVVAAIERQVRKGMTWAAPSTLEAELIGRIRARLPAVQQLRFTSSGTEATLMAMRAARAFTGRRLMAKFEGGYHGIHDYAMISLAPALDAAGPADAPTAIGAAGIPEAVRDSMVVLPFNDEAACLALIQKYRADLAGLIVEPIMGVAGIIAPRRGFLDALSGALKKVGALLIFDEVISLRVAYGGAAGLLDISPDLMCLGKIVGGGMPVGAIGGRRDVMRVFDPSQGPPAVVLSGTFHANPLTMVAGMATLDLMTQEALTALNQKSAGWLQRMRKIFKSAGAVVQVNEAGSLFNIHFTAEPVTDYRAMARSDKRTMSLLQLALLNEGVMMSPRGMGCLSTPMNAADLEFLAGAFERALKAIGFDAADAAPVGLATH